MPEVHEIIMPSMGEGVHEATLIKWLKKKGERVKKGEPLLEVSTDKVDTEIPSSADGFLIGTMADEGSTIEVNNVIAFISEDASASIPTGTTVAKKPAGQKRAEVQQSSQPSFALHDSMSKNEILKRSSPLVRKMAREKGIPLTALQGSGLNGRITKADFFRYLDAPRPGMQAPLLAKLETQIVDGKETLEGVLVRREKMTKMRRLIAEHMVESVRTSPHVTTVFEIDMQTVWNLREKHKNTFESREGFKLTFTHFLIHAAVQAIKLHPVVNNSVDGDDILYKDSINVGCAVALENGLIVPVIKNANDKNLVDIAKGLNDLVTRARNKKLTADDVQGGTFSITNPGGWGSIISNPIINQPQVAMMSIGAIVKRAVVIDDKVVARPMMYAGLTFDHRVIDGEGGSLYLATFKKILENYAWDF